MKKTILMLCLSVICYNCKAQNDTIDSSEITINGINCLSKNVDFLTEHFGSADSIQDYYFEMDEIMSQIYNYDGILFYVINDKVNSFEITNSNYAFTNHNIKIGDSINTLEALYPISYANREVDSLSLPLSDMDFFVVIFFSNSKITKIRLGEY